LHAAGACKGGRTVEGKHGRAVLPAWPPVKQFSSLAFAARAPHPINSHPPGMGPTSSP
jgi:hypothetical protein